MIQKLRFQLNSIRKIIQARTNNIPREISSTLNGIRDVILDIIDEEESQMMEKIINPISISSAGWSSRSETLMVCDQLISLLPDFEIRENHDENLERIIPASKNVFIIHGHDTANLLTLKNLLVERFKLKPIILNQKASKGRTIIEKFEQEAFSSSYAIGLFTPDDEIDIKTIQYYQARPNVIFELGWFYSRLGRDRVSILFKKGTKIHSDLDGIVRIEFMETIEEKILELERELASAGLINNA